VDKIICTELSRLIAENEVAENSFRESLSKIKAWIPSAPISFDWGNFDAHVQRFAISWATSSRAQTALTTHIEAHRCAGGWDIAQVGGGLSKTK